jgi:hypothetical protein
MIGPRPSDPTPQASAATCAYRPCSVSEAAGAFARQVVAEAAPERAARARALLFAASRLAAFGESVALELSTAVLLHPAVIERFILAAPETLSRRMRACALICLGAGAGLVGSELRHVSGEDVLERSGGVLVEVPGCRARAVPVLGRFHEPLLAAAAFAGEGYLLGGEDPLRKNLTSEIAALFCDRSLPRLDTGRLRSTWLAGAAQLIGLHAFMAAAGVRCSQRLGDIAACLPDPGEPEMVRLLGGAP